MPMSHGATKTPRSVGSPLRYMPVPVLSPGHALPVTFPPIGRLPSTVSATDFRQFCSRLRRHYAAVRLLNDSTAASSPRLPVVAHIRRSGVGEMRSPRLRSVPFTCNGVSDHGRAVAPRMTVRNMLPSTLSTVSASAESSLSRLNIPLHMIAVYASRPPSPATTQHLLQGGSPLPYPGRTFTGWTTSALPGALIGDVFDAQARCETGVGVRQLTPNNTNVRSPRRSPRLIVQGLDQHLYLQVPS